MALNLYNFKSGPGNSDSVDSGHFRNRPSEKIGQRLFKNGFESEVIQNWIRCRGYLKSDSN